MTIARRLVLFGLGAPVLLFVVVRAFSLGPAFGVPVHSGAGITARAVGERHATNAVSAVVFDYRGYDTLGEENVLFAAVLGVVLLLRERDGSRRPARHDSDDAVAFAGVPIAAAMLAAAGAIVLHGHLTPGGGFQGGAIAASAFALAYLLGGRAAIERLPGSKALDALEAIGVGGYAAFALTAFGFGRPLLTNVLPLGETGRLFSSGSILLLNVAVGAAVTAGFAQVVLEFIEQEGGHQDAD
jgi:multicomponent Na+:H+ antiporter subunit B